jgi:hypothetical protein
MLQLHVDLQLITPQLWNLPQLDCVVLHALQGK